jgi:hypothetical protein
MDNMTSMEILRQAVLWGRGGMNPTPNNERNFIIGCIAKPKLLELYEGDRLKVWIKAGYPPIDYSILFPEWATLSTAKQEFIARALDYLYRNRTDFLTIYSSIKETFPEHIKGIQVFDIQGTRQNGRITLHGDIYSLLRQEDDTHIKKLLKMTLQFYLI